MNLRHRLQVACALPLALASSARYPQAAPSAGEAQPATTLVFETSPAVDLFFHVRAGLAVIDTPRTTGLERAFEAAQALDKELGGSPLAWGPIEGLLPGCKTAADIGRAFQRAPETFEVRGQSVRLRDGAARLAAELEAAEHAFLEDPRSGRAHPLWKEHDGSIGAARARLDEGFVPKERACLEFHLKSLGMKDPGLAIPVYLTAKGPWPGAVTHRDENGRGVSFVAVEGVEGSQLFEIVLHEATHALDVATEGASAFEELRARLTAAGLGPRDRAFRDLSHALMFVQSAESIRRTVDPAHRDYGEVENVYQRMGRTADVVRGSWLDYLDGKTTREEALDAIAAEAKE